MVITTEEQYLNLFKSKSRILNRPAPDPKRPPRYFDCLDLSPAGIEGLIRERLQLLEQARDAVRVAIADWKYFARTQLLPKDEKPIGSYGEKINYTKARQLCFEAELRELHTLQRKFAAVAVKADQAVHRHQKGVVKFRGGVPAVCDGRALTTDVEGNVRFVDTKELLADYKAKIATAEKTKLGAQRAKQKQVAAAVRVAREIAPKKSRTWRHAG